MSTLRVTRVLAAPRSRVYRALIDPQAIQRWRVPPNMTSQVHEYDAREGGAIRVSLTYRGSEAGKTSAHTDTYRGRFAKLVPDREVVEVIAFDSPDPALCGEMTISFTLVDVDGGTELRAVHDGVPDAVPAADNELGWRQSLDQLAALVEHVPPR